MPERVPMAPADEHTAGTRAALVDALLTTTRAMVGLAARSLTDLDADVTMAQYRALVVLASRGPQRVVDISTELGVDPSTGTRMCDRLARKGLIRRYRSGSGGVRSGIPLWNTYLARQTPRRRTRFRRR